MIIDRYIETENRHWMTIEIDRLNDAAYYMWNGVVNVETTSYLLNTNASSY